MYVIWSCVALGSLQIDIAPPHQISLCPLLAIAYARGGQPFSVCVPKSAKSVTKVFTHQNL